MITPQTTGPRLLSRSEGRSGIAWLLELASAIPRVRPAAIEAVCRLERGQMYSPTFRELMRKYYDVDIGPYSYGLALCPGGLPRGTRIGNYCSIGPGFSAYRRNHPARRISLHPLFYNASLGVVPSDTIHTDQENPLIVEHDTWIGANVVVTPSCKRIGLGAIVGAGAVVTSDVAQFAIVAGNPARQIGDRFPDEVKRKVLESSWWRQPIERLAEILPAFLGDATLDRVQKIQTDLGSTDDV